LLLLLLLLLLQHNQTPHGSIYGHEEASDAPV